MAGRAGSLVFWVAFTPFILHHLGPQRFGLWSLLFVFTTYMLIMDLGVGNALARYAADLRARGRMTLLGDYVGTAGLFYGCLCIVFVLGTWALADPLLAALHIPREIGEARQVLLMSAVVAGLAGFLSLTNGVLTGFQRLVAVNAVALAALVPSGIGIALALRNGWGLPGLLTSQIVATLVALALASIWLYRSTPGLPLRPLAWNRSAARDLFSLGAWMQLTNLTVAMHQHLDKFFLARFTGLGSVTGYELGFRVANGLFALPILALGPVAPVAAELFALGDLPRVRELHGRGLRWIAGLALPLLGATWMAAPWLMRGWLGEVPAGAVGAARFIALGLGLQALTGLGTSILRGKGRPQLEFGCLLACLTLHASLCFALVPRFGLQGALAALVVSNLFWVALFLGLFVARTKLATAVEFLRNLARPGLCAAAGIAAALMVLGRIPGPAMLSRPVSLLLGGGLLVGGTALGLLFLLGTGHFRSEDRRLLLGFVRRGSGSAEPGERSGTPGTPSPDER